MVDQNQSPAVYRSGFVGVLGKPNVGKSTLINALVGHKIAAVSPRPQTTRKRQMGILTLREPPAQIIFIDTPGFHHPRHKLGELMNHETVDILKESDAILLVVDASQLPDADDQLLFNLLSRSSLHLPVLLVLNKTDLVEKEAIEKTSSEFQNYLSSALPVAVSATQGNGLAGLIQSILARLPEGEPYFPDDQLTDLFERDLAADLIREAALKILRDEIPHGIAVRIDQYTERAASGAYIEATLFVERESHKPIVIGQGGKMLKAIGSSARKEIENMSNRKVYLALNVKVRPNWRNDPDILLRFGYR
jgi:GTP-binding protein Era